MGASRPRELYFSVEVMRRRRSRKSKNGRAKHFRAEAESKNRKKEALKKHFATKKDFVPRDE